MEALFVQGIAAEEELKTDLALSLVNIAALKASAGVSVSDDERSAAQELLHVFQSTSRWIEQGAAIPEAVVPREPIRKALEHALEDWGRENRPSGEIADQLKVLIEDLEQLASGSLGQEEASGLLVALSEIDSGE